MVDVSKLSREELEAFANSMAKQAASPLKMKVANSGGVSVYGLGRFPVTLYKSQWDKLLANTSAIQSFIDANVDQLKVKE